METIRDLCSLVPSAEEWIDANQFLSWQCDQQAYDIIVYHDGDFDTSVADSIEKELRLSQSQGKMKVGRGWASERSMHAADTNCTQ